ncbi:MAG TPA: T9SS type A sorting domain-containing protein [Bacteroidales bacterium]|nr:T9SS type A sorting domain-containing protein [Bacteroidales bacterium]
MKNHCKPPFILLIIYCSLFTAQCSLLQAQPCIPNTSSLDFNGSTSFVRIGSLNQLEITNALTIEAWINPKVFASGSTGNSIFCKHAWGSSMFGYVLRCGGNGILSFNIAGAIGGSPVGWQEVLSPAGSLVLNTWQHVAGTFDGSTMSLYIDGNPMGSFAFSGTIYPSTGYKARIGALADTVWSMSRYFNGLIDEVRVWNRALSQAEILAGMNDHIDPALQNGLAGYWRMNENAGNVLADLGSGFNTGTAVNTSWSSQVPFNNTSLPMPTITYVAPNLVSSYTSGNQWYFGTTLIPGATQQTYTPTQYGIYKVFVSDTSGCTAWSLPFNFDLTGINRDGKSGLLVFPNPARDMVFIENIPPEKAGVIEMTDMLGKVVMRQNTDGMPSAEMKISRLNPGVYWLHMNGSGRKYQSRVVVY